ncbi:MAG: ABC transporter ATP-binding protein [Firmicutes bacterium HGW-Firmicutes-7]|nr:MAG: ABC transporter ATP-binding protein [Firmicutes bacterium HGW-Firmicutes-7]
MDLRLSTDNMNDYLSVSSIIDYNNDLIKELAEQINREKKDEIDLIKSTFEYVRDNIHHSADIKGSIVTCNASEVLRFKEGICYAKSHLLAALLRYNGIPVGFCYQKLILCDETAPYVIIHGLNGVFISSINRWIRLDARGNKEGVNAQFNLNEEQLAFPVRIELGEEDLPIIYDKPDYNVVEKLKKHDKVEELFEDLPRSLSTEL